MHNAMEHKALLRIQSCLLGVDMQLMKKEKLLKEIKK